MKKTTLVLSISLSILYSSCCPFIKEQHLGNNFILSEYDNVDRRILYSEEKCSGSGIEIVPMTVREYGYNSKWIIAKSSASRFGTDYKYWIIDKDFVTDILQGKDSALNIIKSHVSGPLDSTSFVQKLQANKVNLTLRKI